MKAEPGANTLAAILAGERRALARAMSAVENETAAGRVLLRQLQPHLGRAHVSGITGPPRKPSSVTSVQRTADIQIDMVQKFMHVIKVVEVACFIKQ